MKKKGIQESADPHVWLDPVLMKTVVDKIQNALSKADPGERLITERMPRNIKKI